MALESPYQFIPRGHMATSLQTLYKTRPAKIVAARDLYRIYAASSSESSLASQSTRRATISSIIIMLIQALMIPPELLRVHLFNSYDTQDFARSIMSSSSSFAITAFSGIFRLIDHKRFGQRRFLFLLRHLDCVLLPLLLIVSRLFRGGHGLRCRGASVPLSRYESPPDTDCTALVEGLNGHFTHMDSFIYSWQAVQLYTVPVAILIVSFLMRETANIPLEDMEKVFEARTRDIVLYQMVLEPFEESRYGTGAIALE
ncbi:hypothetical protein ASPBRDRAFT_50710 [Aspergillus brasiliensis CBS 101740]|uniref:Uncharacterized protein n=1 Tax=Aspergillus brasiliensis (strain CBS 101740 / IMI 381727 / IBT 21946) TaxID=767769 RepID=A0A1L9V1U5_ASPBC|nr:hypothetical protein ASPBRDRAFT_50710 [Aspergillus brasiliensis CBS 101740]